MENIDDEWDKFCNDDMDLSTIKTEEPLVNQVNISDLYISTRTNISYLNKGVDLFNMFWKIPIIEYHVESNGIIKKQMKFSFDSPEKLYIVKEKLKHYNCIDEYIIRHIENPEGRIHFKDVRKISIGLTKKDLLSYRSKKKGAFYNCFVLVLRILYEGKFKEVHVKIFNTGKIEIPGIQKIDILEIILENIIKIFDSIEEKKYNFTNYNETVLINSNFTCGYHIIRQNLYDILKDKYHIICSYDPCSYPGIQCQLYYDSNNEVNIKKEKNKTKMSIMIFRTGSVIIVGKCEEIILYKIYNMFKNILITEYKDIIDNCKIIPTINKIKSKRKIKMINTYA